jgi:L-alanine-DL-glutamate epimerase-like enolase superfamily enzyme
MPRERDKQFIAAMEEGSHVKVNAVDIARCALEMPHPVRLGAVEYRTRDYVLVRVRTDDGRCGFAYGYERGTPLVESLHATAPALLGTSPLQRKGTIDTLLRSNPPGRSSLIRAVSLLDIALWDLAAKEADLPLYQLLGGGRTEVPLLPVCGYFLDVVGEDGLHEQMVDLKARGFDHLKLIGGARTPSDTERFINGCRTAIGPDVALGVDVHYSFSSLDHAVQVGRVLDAANASFLEDPFLPYRWREIAKLSQRISTPLAAGEDVSHPFDFANLLESVSILRLDPTTCGGVTSVLTGLELATASGATVIPHVFPRLSAQLAGAYAQITRVEVILPETGADPIENEMTRPLHIDSGNIVLDDTPGHGIEFDWNEISQRAAAHVTVE